MAAKGQARKMGMGLGRRILVVILVGVLAFSAAAFQGNTVQAATKHGWVTKNGKTYYYNKKGKKVTGWKKISGKVYYFNAKGVLQKNKIAGTQEEGYDYVDKKGVRCRDQAIVLAKNLVLRLTDPAWTPRQKLLRVFEYFVDECVYVSDYYVFAPENFSAIASRMFMRRGGDCNEGALALVFVGTVLGLTSRLCEGYVDYYSRGTPPRFPGNAHGWAEIQIDGKYLVYDISMERAHGSGLYEIPREWYPYAIQADSMYRLAVSGGKPVWK